MFCVSTRSSGRRSLCMFSVVASLPRQVSCRRSRSFAHNDRRVALVRSAPFRYDFFQCSCSRLASGMCARTLRRVAGRDSPLRNEALNTTGLRPQCRRAGDRLRVTISHGVAGSEIDSTISGRYAGLGRCGRSPKRAFDGSRLSRRACCHFIGCCARPRATEGQAR